MAFQVAQSSEDMAQCPDACWICLSDEGTDLERRCLCPRRVHKSCLARWNLQCAGRAEEKLCRFCGADYPDWRPCFKEAEHEPTAPVLSIHFNGEVHMIRAAPGEEGMREFQARVRELLQLEEGQDFDITFDCRVPGSDSRMALHGLGAYDAAVYCASISASERLRRTHTRHLAECGNGPVPRSAPPPGTALAPARTLRRNLSAEVPSSSAALLAESAQRTPTAPISPPLGSRTTSQRLLDVTQPVRQAAMGAPAAPPTVHSLLPAPPRFATRASSCSSDSRPLQEGLNAQSMPAASSSSPALPVPALATIVPMASLPAPPRFAERASADGPTSPLRAGLAAVTATSPPSGGGGQLLGSSRRRRKGGEVPHNVRSWACRLLSI